MRDIIIVGGSFAGLSAALQLARARRSVTVIDADLRRNRFAEHSHGFLGQDGREPGEIVADARRQLLVYPTVEWIDDLAVSAERDESRFIVRVQEGHAIEARRLLLAGGVVDTLPDVPGLGERWGRSVFHCPYCHGYELQQGRIGVVAGGPMAMHQAQLVTEWGATTLLLNGAYEPEPQEIEILEGRGVTIERSRIAGVEDRATVRLADGRTLAFAGLFVAPLIHPSGPLPEQLGCALEEGPLGRWIKVDDLKQTSIPGVFACGDATRMAGSVAISVGDGAMAGASVHRSLVFG